MSETIELNGRRYRKPQRPTVVICVDGCDPEYIDRGIRGRHLSDNRLFPPGGLSRNGGCRGADLHQPEQCLDRDRGAAFGARHCRQLLPRPRERARDHDDRRGPDAQRDDPRADGAGRRQDGGGHRQGQIAQAARAQPRRHLLFVRMCRSPKSKRWSAAAGPTCIRPICRCSCSMPGSRCSSAGMARAALPVALGLCAARARAGRAGSGCVQPGNRRSRAAPLSNWARSSVSSPTTA